MIGDTADLAARLQGLAERGTIIVAGFTCRLLGDECLSRSATLLLLPSNRVRGWMTSFRHCTRKGSAQVVLRVGDSSRAMARFGERLSAELYRPVKQPKL